MSDIEDLVNAENMHMREPRYQIYPVESGTIMGREVYQGEAIACRFCKSTDNWRLLESRTAFICDTECDEHDPTPTAWGPIHTVDSVKAHLVWNKVVECDQYED